jgi:hypothetical protein
MLPGSPGHDLWERDFTGGCGLFSFVFKGGTAARAMRFIDALDLFGIGYSWGGFESLAVPVDPAPTCAAPRRGRPPDMGPGRPLRRAPVRSGWRMRATLSPTSNAVSPPGAPRKADLTPPKVILTGSPPALEAMAAA